MPREVLRGAHDHAINTGVDASNDDVLVRDGPKPDGDVDTLGDEADLSGRVEKLDLHLGKVLHEGQDQAVQDVADRRYPQHTARHVVHAADRAPRLLRVALDAASPAVELLAGGGEYELTGASVEQPHAELGL
ncbi:MAG: hypothetical protein AAF721_32640 [Myxococcota bacterium]